jgi:hypothetical protein
MISTSTTEDDGEALAMLASYRATAPDRTGVVCAPGLDPICDFLRRESSWPAGGYEISVVEVLLDSPRQRWGVAIKHPDGTVELVPNRLV